MMRESDDRRLKAALEAALPGAEVRFDRSEFSSTYVIVTAVQFAGLDEAQQQAIVWGVAMDTLGDDLASDIDFIFTYTPDERVPAAR